MCLENTLYTRVYECSSLLLSIFIFFSLFSFAFLMKHNRLVTRMISFLFILQIKLWTYVCNISIYLFFSFVFFSHLNLYSFLHSQSEYYWVVVIVNFGISFLFTCPSFGSTTYIHHIVICMYKVRIYLYTYNICMTFFVSFLCRLYFSFYIFR